ncbi:MAG TPA: hypothetical protein VHM19_06135, partial [Polyangiales bacterium]|nr:hypothetical protein [Polyangiales bacterium]
MGAKIKRVMRWIVRGIAGLLALVVLVLALVVIATQVQPGRDLARDILVNVLHGVLEAKVEIDRIDRIGFGYASASGVRIRGAHGEVAASAKRISIHLDPLALLEHQLHLAFVRATVIEPMVDLGEPGGAGGGLPDAIGSEPSPEPEPKPEPESKSAPLVVTFAKLHVVRGTLRVKVNGQARELGDLDALGEIKLAESFRVYVSNLY